MVGSVPQNKSAVILMTACIIPDGMGFTALQNPEIRKAQYLEAIDFYLNNTACDIVFCENTGTDIFDQIASPEKYRRLEYLTFRGNDYDKNIGKGYGEAMIIGHAIRNSQLIQRADYIIKVTGRVKVLNIGEVFDIAARGGKRPVIALELSSEDWAKSVCFMAPKYWLGNIVEKEGCLLDDINGKSFETMLYRAIVQSPQMSLRRFYPIIDGVSGSSGAPYINLTSGHRKMRHNYALHCIYKSRGGLINRIVSVVLLLRYFAALRHA